MSYAFVFISLMLSGAMNSPKTYTAKKIARDFSVSGSGTDAQWQGASLLTDFIFPWDDGKAPMTSFKALHSNDWLYCFFTVEDSAIHVYVDKNDKSEVVYSDRVEIFIRKDEKMSPYYGLELDPHGRVLDYKAEFHRKFGGEWSWPSGQLVVKASLVRGGYAVEVAISKVSLRQLGLLDRDRLQVGLFRGECVALRGKEADIKWISWVRPDSPTPDFHIPSAFGLLVLEE